jgi:toxin ParE1/3/4
MGYLVRITERAQRDLETLFQEKQAETSAASLKWYRGLRKAILSLEQMPARCPCAPEGLAFRNLLYGRKPHVDRILFRISESEMLVDVLHIRHGARHPAPPFRLK